MEIIPEFATPRDWMVYVFLILKSPATLRRTLAHIVLLRLRYVAHLPILSFFSYVTSHTCPYCPSSATLRRTLAHIGTLQRRVKRPTLWEYFHFLKRGAKRLVSKSENIPKVFYTFLQLRTQGKNTPFLSAENKKRAILLRVFYFRRSKKAKIFAPTG